MTNAQYARFVAATHRRPPINWKDGRIPQGELMNPVTMVTWNDAADYAEWMGKRLPHEAELEKAGRARRTPLAMGRKNGSEPPQHVLQRRIGDQCDGLPAGQEHLRGL